MENGRGRSPKSASCRSGSRAAAAAVRGAIESGDAAVTTSEAATARIEGDAAAVLRDVFRPSLQPVINATGVVIHTNLGRAPLAEAAIDHVAAVARGYASLE